MKKYILYSFITLFSAFFLAGCGSNAISDDGKSVATEVLEVIPGKVDKNGLGFSINIPIIKKLDQNVKLKLDNFVLNVDGCIVNNMQANPDPLLLDGPIGESTTITVIGQFQQDCTPTAYSIHADETIIEGEKSKTLPNKTLVAVQIDENGNPTSTVTNNPSGIEYHLTDPTTPVVVNQPNEVQQITAIVVDKLGIGVEGISVKITAISNPKYGSIESAASVLTDSSGRATFSYRGPSDIVAVDGEATSVNILMDINGTIVDQKVVTIEFQKVDQNTTIPTVIIADTYKDINITDNGQNAEIQVQVFAEGTNTPYTEGSVRVALPEIVLTGTDVGHFSSYTAPVGSNGVAIFNYTAPQDIRTLVDQNITTLAFKFFHETNPTQQETAQVVFSPQSNYVPANYLLSTSSIDNSQAMGLETTKTFTLYLKDDQGNLIDDSQITAITLTSQNIRLGKLIDTDTGAEVDTLTYNSNDAINSKSFTIQTYQLSGLLQVKMTVSFIDANGDTQTLEKIMNVVVMSGPPTALSISYAGVEQDTTNAKYIEKFAVTVTDQYNNPVNTRPYIATGSIVEYAVDGSSPTGERTTTSPRLWHGRLDTPGTLEQIGGNKAQLTTTTDTFNYIDLANDKLVTFASGYVYEALGKWDIESAFNQSLQLKDDYFGTTRDPIYFAVGHNNREDLCAPDARQYVGNMKATNIQLDATGHALLEFEYDYHLTGKDIMVWVNLEGYQADSNATGRIGDAIKHTLRGAGFTHAPSDGYSLPKGASAYVQFDIWHENAPERYHNGHFGHAIKSGSTCASRYIVSSNDFDARACDTTVAIDTDNNATTPSVTYGSGSGDAYVVYFIQAPVDKACTFDITNINVASEFTGVNSY